VKLPCIRFDGGEATRLCGLLEEKGIPIYRGRKSFGSGSGWIMAGYPLFVCLDSQFKDAQTILKFPSHVPAEPVDAKKFHEDIEAAGYGPVLHLILLPALGIGLLCLLVIWAVYYFGHSAHI
jgi:hypothetical protein